MNCANPNCDCGGTCAVNDEKKISRVIVKANDPITVRAAKKGAELADKIFSQRGTKGRKHSEAHVSETELAAMLALAYEAGAKTEAALIRMNADRMKETGQ